MLITSDIRDQAYRLFLEEVPELLQILENGLLSLRQSQSRNEIHELMRAAHSLKGGAACLEFDAITTIAHRLEDIFRALHSQTIEIDLELETLLLKAYDCLCLPLIQQISTGRYDSETVLEAATPVFDAIRGHLGTALDQVDRYIPSSTDSGIDLVASIFDVDVAKGLEHLAKVIANAQDYHLAGELTAQTEVFAGFADLLNLPGFGAIAQTAQIALSTQPGQALQIAQLALTDFHAGREMVLAGDRQLGGNPSPPLLALAQLGEIPDNSAHLTPDHGFQGKIPLTSESINLENFLLEPSESFESLPTTLPKGILFPDALETIEEFEESELSGVLNVNAVDAFSSDLPSSWPRSNPIEQPISLDSCSTPTPNPVQALTQINESSAGKGAVSTRVELTRLDRMHKLVSELIIQRNTVTSKNQQVQNSADELLRRFNHFQDMVGLLRNVIDTAPSIPNREDHSQHTHTNSVRTDFNRRSWSKLTAFDPAVDTQFDPLEMDQYGMLNVLVHRILEEIVQLEESVEDVVLFSEQSQQGLEQKQRMLTQLQDELMWARMLPLGEMFNRFPRMLRDLCALHGKTVHLQLEGADIQVEKAILEKLFDPLLHLLRNAFDHGIELPEIRQQWGKPDTGVITIQAHHQGNQTIIEVKDDGRGIRLDRIRDRAIALDWISASDSARMSPEQLLDLIFQPGFSTANQVSELSGRGVGLDVVRSQMRLLKGSVKVESNPGEGTTFTLRLPLTLTIAKLLICTSGSKFVAFPSDSVGEIVIPTADQIKHSGMQSFLLWQEKLIPIYKLTKLLDYTYPLPKFPVEKVPMADSSPSGSCSPLLLFDRQSDGFALEVDRLLNEQELVIKPFGSAISPPDSAYGCTDLGDGRLIPVIHGAALLEQSLNSRKTLSPPSLQNSREGPSVISPPMILVVDDSTTMRQTLTLSLQRAGYSVLQARDGLNALETLQQTPEINLILCDIEMPNMNGFEFLDQRRQDSRMVNIPVVMLSSRSNSKHQRLAMTLGATAYFTKPYVELKFLEALNDILHPVL